MRPEQPSSLPEGSSRRRLREEAATRDAAQDAATREAASAQDPASIAVDGGTPARRRRRRVWPWVLLGVLVLLVIVGAIAAVVGLRFMDEVKVARGALEKAKAGLSTLSEQLTADTPDEVAIQATADGITADVKVAADTVEGDLWDIAARVPFVGQNVDAVQRVTRAVDILVDQALPPGMRFLSTVDMKKIAVEGGGIDLEPFRQVQGDIPQLAAAFAAAEVQVAPIDTTALLPEVSGPIAEILDIIDAAAPALAVADAYLPTLLDIAGSGGTKTYLLIFQNNAEIRATGGNPAASMIVTLSDGRLGYADQASSATFYAAGTAGESFVDLPAETTGLYLPTFTAYSQDYTFTPDFPTTAALFQALWAQTTGANFDGVISIDPVVLANMLAVAGPVTLADGEQLTSENAVKVLLSDSYERFPDGATSDLFFADASRRVFDHLTSATWDPTAMLDALTRSAQEQRVYLSFTDPAAQALAVEFGLDGALQTDNTTQTQVGIYLNDSSVGKLEYHLTTSVAASCDANARTMTTTMTLANTIPSDIQSSYTLGGRNGSYGLSRTTMMLDVLFFAPPGASIVSTDPVRGEVRAWERSGVEKGNTALSKTVFVAKDATETVSYTVALPAGDLGPLNLRYTPTANPTAVTVDASCDALFPPAALPQPQG